MTVAIKGQGEYMDMEIMRLGYQARLFASHSLPVLTFQTINDELWHAFSLTETYSVSDEPNPSRVSVMDVSLTIR